MKDNLQNCKTKEHTDIDTQKEVAITKGLRKTNGRRIWASGG